MFEREAELKRLANGFGNASGLTASDTGVVFFTDAANKKIFRWNDGVKKAELLASRSTPV